MKTYWATLLGVMVLSVVINMICHDGNLKKYVRLLSTLCVLCVLAAPLISLASEGGLDGGALWEELVETPSEDYDEIYHQALLNGSADYLESTLKSEMASSFSLASESFDVEAQFVSENDTYKLDEIRITLRDSAIFADPKQMISYVNEQLECDCVIIYN